jgi:hypothetical protein
MNKVNLRIEKIFAHGAALQQNGRLRNTIYCNKNFVYILNQDHTVFLRFSLRDTEKAFANPISFAANDYDSNSFFEKDGKIHFVQENDDYTRIKSCKTPQFTPKKIAKLFKTKKESFKKTNEVVFKDNLLSLLDESLSHIEFHAEGGELVITQRNIYSGSVLDIKKNTKKGGLVSSSKLTDFEPIGVRTNDFIALFSFTNVVHFYFNDKNLVWFENKDKAMPFVGMISQCVYDELGQES